MTKFVAEKNFFIIFQAFYTYFFEEIMNRNLGCLIHKGSFKHYIPSLVKKIYNSFTNNDIDNHAYRIHINWRRETKVLNLQLLSDLIELSLALGLNQIPIRVEEISLIGENYRIFTCEGRCKNSLS